LARTAARRLAVHRKISDSPAKAALSGESLLDSQAHSFHTARLRIIMYYLLYASSASRPFSEAELLELLAKARENNARLDITGMLLYKDGNFMQALEGEESAVKALYEKISRDPRHKGVLSFIQGRTAERQFPDWSMAYRNLNDPEALNTPGYSEFLSSQLTGDEFAVDPTRCQKLLLTFKENLR
jgi:hypothetical protein